MGRIVVSSFWSQVEERNINNFKLYTIWDKSIVITWVPNVSILTENSFFYDLPKFVTSWRSYDLYSMAKVCAQYYFFDFIPSKRLCFVIGYILEPGFETKSTFLSQHFRINCINFISVVYSHLKLTFNISPNFHGVPT